MSKISDDARAMIGILNCRGWFQGWYNNPSTGEVCFLGARNIAVGESVDSSCVDLHNDPLTNACREYLGITDYMHHWNDEPGRTKEEVLSMLEDVAIKHDDDQMRIKP